MYIGLPNSDLSEDAYTLTNLVIKPLMEFTRWIHLYLRLKIITMLAPVAC